MVWAIFLTLVVAVMGTTLAYTWFRCRRREAENRRLADENEGLKRRISDGCEQEQRRKERAAYERGLYDGRQTDALYRSVLRRYSAREQVSVMINGENRGGQDA